MTGAVTGTDVEPDASIPGSDVIDDVVPTLTPKRDLPGLRRNKDVVKATTAAPRTVVDGVDQARGEIRGGVTKAVKDVSQAARSDKRGALRQAVADARSAVADGVTKGVKKAAEGK